MYKSILVFILFSICIRIQAQYKTISSASEAGWTNSPVFSQNKLAGQLSAGYSGSLVTNFQNPASYADANLTSVDIGVHALSGSYQYNDSTLSSSGVGLTHFAIQMPLTNGKSGLSLGFFRNSSTNYGIRYSGYDSSFGSLYNYKSGKGNIYQAYIGTGFRFSKFKIGGNLGLTFGQVEHTNDIVFSDSSTLPTIANRNAISEIGLQYTLGAQYEIETGKDKHLILGGYYTSTLTKSGQIENKKQSIFKQNGNYEYNTLSDTTYDIDLPKYNKLGLGMSYLRNKTLLLGTEINIEDYSNYKSMLSTSKLENAWHLHLGMEYKPYMNRNISTRKYLNRLTYRFGTILGKNQYNLGGSLNDLEFSGGATLPILGRNVGYITVGGSYRIRGFGGNTSQVTDNIMTLNIILTFADKWFLRQKFD